MHLPKRFILIVLIFIFSYVFIQPSFVKAATSWAVQSPEDFMDCIDGTFANQEVCGQAYSGMFVPMNLVYGANCLLAGVNCSKDDIRAEEFFNRSAFGQTSNLVGALYTNPPANTGTWFADVATNIGIAPKAYAQGIGFSALSPLLGLWKVMRNISYALLIIVLLVIGLMIMFRAKIDPRTVISIQSALPRIVITLLLITFSYPLAGLMIDLMYVVLFLGISIIAQPGLFPNATTQTVTGLQAEFASGGGLFRIFGSIPGSVVTEGLVSIVGIALIPLTAGLKVLTGLKGFITAVRTSTAAGQIAGGAALGTIGLGGIVFLLVILAFLFAVVRIFFILLNSYIQLIIAVIFAPILLLGSAIPGQNAFSSWIRNILANLSVFPTTAILILVADVVSAQFYPGALPKPLWVPPLVDSFGSFLSGVLIPLGFALVIPQLVLSIKKLFGAKPIVPVGAAVGRAIGQPVGVGQQALQTIGSIKLALGTGGGRAH